MASLELVNVSHRYAAHEWAVRDVNLRWEDGVASALLGPSGSGKTTVLGIISGLLRPTEGRVLIDGRDVTDLSARERDVAQVFQFPVVYDTMDVYGNIAFPLRNQGLARDLVDRRVRETARLLELEDHLRRSAARLGAAEQQRVSLARGIVREDISAVLLDEPLTVIDPQAKWHLRRQLKALHERVGTTMIYVTHDQHEALTFADQVTVMDVGRVQQTGSPQELHERPEAPFVGYFIGSPGMNVLDARLNESGLEFGEMKLPVDEEVRARLARAQRLRVGIRPEFVEVRPRAFAGAQSARVREADPTGRGFVLHLDTQGLALRASVSEEHAFAPSDEAWVALPPEHLHVYADEVRVEGAT